MNRIDSTGVDELALRLARAREDALRISTKTASSPPPNPDAALKRRNNQSRIAQRARRSRQRRLDYQNASPEAVAVIKALQADLRARGQPHSVSAVLNELVIQSVGRKQIKASDRPAREGHCRTR